MRSPTLSLRAYQRESQSLITPTRNPWGLTFCPIVTSCLRLLAHTDGDVSGSLQNTIVSAPSSGHAALENGAGVGDSSGNIELFSVHGIVVLCVGDGASQELENGLGSSLGGLHQVGRRGLDVLAADQVTEDLDLAGRDAQVFQMSFRFHDLASSLFRIGGLAAGVTSEGSGGDELAELVADHILG